MKTTEITNNENIIDSRDIIARIEHLREYLDALVDAVTDSDNSEDDETTRQQLAEWLECEMEQLPENIEKVRTGKDCKECFGSDDAKELLALEALASECEGSPDWTYGETIIHDSYFENYARELADDIGAINKEAGWPCCHIDWSAAADALKQDYMEVDFDGTSYWIRA